MMKPEILHTRRLRNSFRREDGEEISSNYSYQKLQAHAFASLVQFPIGSDLFSENIFIKLHCLSDVTYTFLLDVFVLPSTRCY